MDIDVQNFTVINLRRRPQAIEAGGFVVGIDPTTTSAYVNYATPVPGARPAEHDIAALIGVFRERGLKPRLEFAPHAAPEVAPALRRAGFTTEAVHTYLVCTPATRAGTPDGRLVVETPVTDADFTAIDIALSEAYGSEFPPSPQGVARLRRTQEGGGEVRFVRSADRGCAGAASCSAPAVGTAELAGVGTRPAHRGRGVAGAVTASLAEAMFAKGADSVWLEYGGEGSRRVYERVGFRPRGTRLYMALEG
ncbi:GNAT family N-acetyltransferase [Streptomyces sp. YIM 121038]|uniref:GNAT family N-acetyltransferase n=1 Tax=Streptomyces sp. YIM 121038 TaxID=2136401 RepID=UPI0011103024|nr:GNAT family N-acetyltransferase [Streptomyces sp. YIM 121038]